MIYLLDANILITAAASFYKLSRVPEYWEWLRYHAECGNVKVPQEILDEVGRGKDELSKWVKERECRDALLLKESADPATLQHVLDNSYGKHLNEVELVKIGRDPFLVAYAFGRSERCVVTQEVSQSGRQRSNTKLPDACNKVGVNWISAAQFLDVLDFRTNWNS